MGLRQSPNRDGLLLVVLLAACLYIFADDVAAEWLNHGGDITNRRYAAGELLISPTTVPRLRLKWKFFAGKDITATPAVANGVLYFPSWNGNVYAVDAHDGSQKWKINLGELLNLTVPGTFVNVSVSRATPVVADDLLIIGVYGPAVVIAVKRLTGKLVWSTKLDNNPLAQITQSGTVYFGGFYVGVSSLENTLPASQCCSFRGSLAKLDLRTGAILWQTYTVPDNGGKLNGYAGASIWGSSPSIDIIRSLVFVGTGQLYSAPPDVLECQRQQNNQPNVSHPVQCVGPDAHFDSILALDLRTGMIKWSRQLGGYDIFIFVCLVPNNPDCPPGPILDADFGEAPMLLSIVVNGSKRDVVVAVQKNGFAWALDRNDGTIVWFKKAGPGGLEGGGVWGAATEGKRVYTNIVNSFNLNFTLSPSNRTTTSGGWVALDANSGQILWTTADPAKETAHAPVTIANGVLFAGSVAPNGPFYAFDAKNGNILWTYNTNATMYGGAAVSYGCVYVGSGYSVGLAKFHPTWTSGTSLFAFCVL